MPMNRTAIARGLALIVVAAPAFFFLVRANGDAIDKVVPAAVADEGGVTAPEKVVLAGGCFWGMQAVFEHVKGVSKVVTGYSGGNRETATYDQVTTETTGHAESIEITFDPKIVSFGTLLRVYFSVAHDPTELDRQGPDEGNSYRSEIFAASPEQARVARDYIAQLDKGHVFAEPIVTKVEPLKGFYRAEEYHQDFLIKNPSYPYIVINDKPKIVALKRLFPSIYRDTPVKLASTSP